MLSHTGATDYYGSHFWVNFSPASCAVSRSGNFGRIGRKVEPQCVVLLYGKQEGTTIIEHL